jgi:hypothetical protein
MKTFALGSIAVLLLSGLTVSTVGANPVCSALFATHEAIESAVTDGTSVLEAQSHSEKFLLNLLRHGKITGWDKVLNHYGQNEVFIVSFAGTPVRAAAKLLDPSERGVDEAVYLISERTGLKNYPFTTERRINGKRYVMHLYLDGYVNPMTITMPPTTHPSYIRQMVLEYIIGDVDHNPPDLMYNLKTSHWAYIDATCAFMMAEFGLTPEMVQPFKLWGQHSFLQKQYLADREFFDSLEKINPEEVFAKLPVKNPDRAALVPFAKARLIKLQHQIRELQHQTRE